VAGFLKLSRADRGTVLWRTTASALVGLALAHLIDRLLFRHLEEEARLMGEAETMLLSLGLFTPLCFFMFVQIAHLQAANRHLAMLAATDALTGCLNKGGFTALVADWIDRSSQFQGALLVADVDHFKHINDGYGHDQGDIALKLIADALRASIRSGDLLGRIGGEEFAVFLPDADAQSAIDIAERMRSGVTRSGFAPGGIFHRLTISVGCAAFGGPVSYTELFKQADERLYDAKRAGRDRIEIVRLDGGSAIAARA
jgi:diguanylate cyclase (GGDEF)-like protein